MPLCVFPTGTSFFFLACSVAMQVETAVKDSTSEYIHPSPGEVSFLICVIILLGTRITDLRADSACSYIYMHV